MKVPGAPSAVPDARADEEYAQIFRQYFRNLVRFIAVRVSDQHRHLAEDLAQETFIDLWQDFALTGRLKDVERVYPLLATMARRKIGTFYAVRGNSLDRATDFGDPIAAARAFTGHSYVDGTPHLAELGREFDAAMTAMTEASKAWRDKDQVRGKLRRYLNDDARYFQGGLTPETKARMQTDLGQAETAEAYALNAFRAACEQVASLRAELDGVAGGNWRSASGLPVSAGTRQRQDGSYTSDPTVTHCPEGHLLDRDNTYFYDNGKRACRYCAAERTSKKGKPASKRPATVTTSPEVIEAARNLLVDPAHAGLSLEAIAKRVGVSPSVLGSRLPAEVAARKSLRSADPDVLDAARRLLRDPANDTLTLHQVADKAGCSYQTVSRRLRADVAARQARQNAFLDTARSMLADPAYLKVSVVRIAKQVGSSETALYARLPVSELRRSARDAQMAASR